MNKLKVVIVSIALSFFCISANDHFSGGSGTISDPFQITTALHLNNLQFYTGPEHKDKHFKLMNDIDISHSGWDNWTPAGSMISATDYSAFEGTFDGNDKVVSNLAITRLDQFNGLFGYVKGHIKSLTLDSVKITGGNFTGGLCGRLDSGSIVDCRINGTVAGDNWVGGLIGEVRLNARIDNCHANVKTSGQQQVGGLVGRLAPGTTAIDCHSTGEINGDRYIGGFVGQSDRGIFKRNFSTSITSANMNSGGFVGECLSCTIDSCYSNGDVMTQSDIAGGFAGSLYGTGLIINCYSTGTVQSEGESTGGFVGHNNYRIDFCRASGPVSGKNMCGGFVGHNSGIISRSSCFGNVQGTVSTGGFAGQSSNMIQTSFSSGNVCGTDKVGGFTGNAGGAISDSYTTGNVEGTTTLVAALAGNVDRPLERCYSTGTVTTPSHSGAFARDGYPRVHKYCFYDITTSGYNDTLNVKPLPTEQMTRRNSFENWDFDTLWTIEEGTTYPFLQWQSTPLSFNFIPIPTLLSSFNSAFVQRQISAAKIVDSDIIFEEGDNILKLYSLSGILLKTKSIRGPAQYSTSGQPDLPRGIYLVIIHSPGKKNVCGRIIKK